MSSKAHQIKIEKPGRATWVFRFQEADAGAVLDHIGQLAVSDADFSWVDAAVVSYQVGMILERALTPELDEA